MKLTIDVILFWEFLCNHGGLRAGRKIYTKKVS